jgi:hypothetical protein
MAKRFVSGFALTIDRTFDTNKLRLALLVAVGTTNTGNTFPVFFSFCPAEDRASFNFCWKSFKECLHNQGVALAREAGEVRSPALGVIIADWAPGLTSRS